MEIEIKTITPKEARQIIRRGMAAPHDMDRVVGFVDKMNSGEWKNVDETSAYKGYHYSVPLIFTDAGKLWEGKHRILSLALSECEGYKFACVTGWKAENATAEYINGNKRPDRWSFLFHAVRKLIENDGQKTNLDDLTENVL